jgi:hypothetical protein
MRLSPHSPRSQWTIALIAAFAVLGTAACSTQQKAPADNIATITSTPRIKIDVTDKADVTYMARYLLPGRFQSASAIYGGLGNNPSSGLSPIGANVVGAGVAGAMAQNPVSRSGAPNALYGGAAAEAFLGFAGSKSAADVVGRVYLPDHINGQAVTSVAQAREFIRQDVRRRIDEYAALTGRMVVCFDQCDSFYPTYRLTKVGSGQAWPYYDPADLYITFFIHKPLDKRMKEDAVLDKVLTFDNAWEGAFFIALNSARPAGGHITEDGDSVPEFQDTSAFAHPVERMLLRVLTKGGNYAVGSQDWHQFAWNGRVFALGDKLDLDNLIQYEIAPATDTPGGSA